jgi:hypothetical protein
VPLGFSPLLNKDPVEEVRATLALLDSTGAKMLKLEGVGGGQLEAEGCALVKVAVEYVLTCFQSQDPQISLEPVVQGPVTEVEEAARVGIEDTAVLIAEWFEQELEDD